MLPMYTPPPPPPPLSRSAVTARRRGLGGAAAAAERSAGSSSVRNPGRWPGTSERNVQTMVQCTAIEIRPTVAPI